MKYDYSSVGFYTFDCLGWPYVSVPPGGGTVLLDDITLAVSGAAGVAAIVGAKLGLKTKAVGGVGRDLMGDWVLNRIADFGVDMEDLRRYPDVPTSSTIVLTRADGSRPALHVKGATGAFVIEPDRFDAVTDATVFHMGGIGLMDAMDGARNAALIKHARSRGCITTVDVFAGSKADLPDVEAVLPYTDYFHPLCRRGSGTERVDQPDGYGAVFPGPWRRMLCVHTGRERRLLPPSRRDELYHAGLRGRGEMHLWLW